MKKKNRSLAALLLLLTFLFYSGCTYFGFSEEETLDKSGVQDNTLVSGTDKAETEKLENPLYIRSAEDIDYNIYNVYVKVYPTYNSNGHYITREAFKKHKSLLKTYNPTLNCDVWQGEAGETNEGDITSADAMTGTIRVRGNSSRGNLVKNYKIKLTEAGDRIFGHDSLNINKHFQDTTRGINKTCMDIMQFLPQDFVSLNTKYVHLYIMDVDTSGETTEFQDQGIYTFIEQPNKDFLTNHGLDPNGSIYKPIAFEFLSYENEIKLEDDPLYDKETFESVIKPMVNPDHEKLRKMLDAVNDYSLDFTEVMNKYFDEDNYLTWMAFNILLGNMDTLAHNFLLYSPSGSEKWFMLPWDFDGSLVYHEVTNMGRYNYQTYGIHYYWSIPMHQRYFRIEGNLEKLNDRISELMETVTSEENITYIEEKTTEIMAGFFLESVDTQMEIENLLAKGYSEGERLSAMENPNEEYFKGVKEEISLWYKTIKNNYDRYFLNLENPTSGHVLGPYYENGEYVFRWEASYDFQNEIVTYDFVIASDPQLTNIIYEKKDLSVSIVTLDELPKGHLFYRYVAKDESGNTQYPLNRVVLKNQEGEVVMRTRGIGYYDNGAEEKYIVDLEIAGDTDDEVDEE